jgi:sigma54-dependent transcription regulator
MARRVNKGEREADLNLITELYTKGRSYREIAFEVNQRHGRKITYQTVSNEIKKLLKEWEKSRNDIIDHQKTVELAKIDRLEKTYWDGYEKSCQPVKKTSTKKKGSVKQVNDVEMVSNEETRVGDPRFLDGIKWCIEQRCKIFGINAPQKFDVETNMFQELMKSATSA